MLNLLNWFSFLQKILRVKPIFWKVLLQGGTWINLWSVETCFLLLRSISGRWTSREPRLSLNQAEVQGMAAGFNLSCGVWKLFPPLEGQSHASWHFEPFFTWTPLWSSSLLFPLSVSIWQICSSQHSSLPMSSFTSSTTLFSSDWHWDTRAAHLPDPVSPSCCSHCTTKIL